MNKHIAQIRKEYLLLSIILFLTLVTRLYRVNSPLADWHSWRQADTSAVTRRFVAGGIDLFHPRYDDLSSIPSGMDNPQGWRFVEFPFVNATTAILYENLPLTSLETWGRITSIIFSMGSVLLLYSLVKRFATPRISFFSAGVFALLPFNIYYHRTILPEVPMLFMSLLAFYFFVRWLKSQRKVDFVISSVAFALGMLLKPYILFMGLPMLYLTLSKWKTGFIKHKGLFVYLVISLAPFIAWRMWAAQFPQGIPAYEWLLNGSGIRFRPAFFRWIFAERIGKLILGFWGLIPFGLGLIRKPEAKTGWVFHWWLTAMLAYLVIFATGNVTHDYYQIFIVPPIAVFVAKGLDVMLTRQKQVFSRRLSVLLAVICIVFGAGFAWFHVRDFFNVNHPEIVAAGVAANNILPENAKVIAPYLGDTAFLYQTKRQGWPIGGDIAGKIALGATDYVSVTMDEETKMLIESCRPSIKIDEFTIISLKNCSL